MHCVCTLLPLSTHQVQCTQQTTHGSIGIVYILPHKLTRAPVLEYCLFAVFQLVGGNLIKRMFYLGLCTTYAQCELDS